jgi:hypothetical protein
VSLKSSGKTFRANGAVGSVAFTAQGSPGAAITVESIVVDAPWITIDSGYVSQLLTLNPKGKAQGTVKYHVAAYDMASPSPRRGTLQIGGQPFTVSQTGVKCTISVSPVASSFGAGADEGVIQVSTPSGCTWSATVESRAPWIALNGGASREGAGSVSYSVAANTTEKTRKGKVYVALTGGNGQKKVHTVTQNFGVVTPAQQLVVFAWNDLGMHCLNPTYDEAVILPPYNTLWAQVVRRDNPPAVVTTGISVEYRILNNTYSYGKRSYGQFWDNITGLFGIPFLARDTGLNLEDPAIHNGLNGTMVVKDDHFQANGIPLTPVDDTGIWSPYQVAEITVRDSTSGNILAQTRTTAPTSDEIRCDGCHGLTVASILKAHDDAQGTSLQTQKPVLCASCHASPALGSTGQAGVPYLSQSIHLFHGSLDPLKQPACYDCHPGSLTKCSRSLRHTAADGNCTTCHGSLYEVGNSIATAGRTPWLSEPACSKCHGGTAIPEVDTGTALYRFSAGHGGVRCSACHGSPHAMVPSRESSDNYQAMQYQGKAVSIGSCGACHQNSRGEGLNEFAQAHGGTRPEERNGCHICHTVVSATPSLWPHQYKWNAR